MSGRHCYKLAFHSPEQAERTAQIILSQGLRSADVAPKRLYLCEECGMWHWTSRAHGWSESVEVRLLPPPAPPPVAAEPPSPPKPTPPVPQHVRDSRTAAEVAKSQKDAETRYKAQTTWLKKRIQEVYDLLDSAGASAIEDALILLDAASSLPQKGDPDSAEGRAAYAERMVRQREYLRARSTPSAEPRP